MRRLNLFILRNRHVWPILYGFIYLPWFCFLEMKYDNLDYVHLIHSTIDDIIPFCEIFIIPYLLWFLYIPLVFVTLYLSSNKEFYRICAFEFVGMTLALFICTVYPNGHDLRVDLSIRDNVFIRLLSFIYDTDTSTNVFPSIHVFATLAAHICLVNSPQIKARPYIKPISSILAVLICISTVTLKQHSIIDLAGGVALTVIMYLVVFKWWFRNTVIPDINHDKHQVLWWLDK